jgi:hypothetical protein
VSEIEFRQAKNANNLERADVGPVGSGTWISEILGCGIQEWKEHWRYTQFLTREMQGSVNAQFTGST